VRFAACWTRMARPLPPSSARSSPPVRCHRHTEARHDRARAAGAARVLYTAIAHRKKATRTDPTGWGSKFCKRLNINRNGKPYRDSVEHRAGIDMESRGEARRKQVQEFEVGDEVVCKDGAGTVIWRDPASIMIRVDIDRTCRL